MRILVTTPTGNIGRRVLDRLLATSHDITVLVRDPARLPEAVRARATIVTGALEDAAALGRALAGADAAFLLVPPNFTEADWFGWMRRVGTTMVSAVRATGVRRVVLLSSIGADRPKHGPISVLGEIERQLEAAAPNVVSLRAGYFMENLLNAVPTLKAEGVMYQPHPTDLPIDFVATRDIGDVAADELLDGTWSGHRVREVLGAGGRTLAEAAAVIGAELGRPVTCVSIPAEGLRQALLGMGASASVAAGYTEMVEGLNASRFAHGPRTPATTTPTTLEAFVREVLAPAVRQG